MSWDSSRPPFTRATKAMTARVLCEQPLCADPTCDAASVEDDHIIPWSQRLRFGMTAEQWQARANHQGLCAFHHQRKTQREALAGRTSNKRPTEAHPGLR